MKKLLFSAIRSWQYRGCVLTSFLGWMLLVLFLWTIVSNLPLLRDWFLIIGFLNSVHKGLEHCITAPIGTERNPLIAEDEIMISRSMTEKRGLRRHDLLLDRLSEDEKVYASFTVCGWPKISRLCLCIFEKCSYSVFL